MTIVATSLKNGTTFEIDGKPYKVVKYFHQKIGRGGATVRVTVRNLKTDSLEEKTFNSTAKFEEIQTSKKPLQYLYNDGKTAYFMDEKTYEQVEIPFSVIESEINYIKEGQSANVLFLDNSALSIEIPPKVTLEVIDTPPGVKGNSATNIYKTAKLENNTSVKVPLFVKKGEKIVVDTRSGEYVERAK